MPQKGANAAVNKAKVLFPQKKNNRAGTECEAWEAILQRELRLRKRGPMGDTTPNPRRSLLPLPISSQPTPPLPIRDCSRDIKVWFQRVMFYIRGFLPTILFFTTTSSFSGDLEMFQTPNLLCAAPSNAAVATQVKTLPFL